MAYVFGDHPSVAAFLIAFRFSNLLRRFFSEGPFQSAFIPYFEELRHRDEKIAYTFFKRLTQFLSVILLMIVMAFAVGLWSTLRFFSSESREIVRLTLWTLPCLIFVCLYGFNLSFLLCHNSLFVSSAAPILCNIIWIVGAICLKGRMVGEAMPILARCVVVGFVVQWAVTLPQVRRFMRKKTEAASVKKEMTGLAQVFFLNALGVGAVQINSFLDVIFAKYAHPSGPVYLWYANRFQQLAFSVLGVSAVNTLVPILSKSIKCGKVEEGREVFSFGCRTIITMMFLITCAIYMLGFSAIDLVFGRGNFSLYSVEQTTACLKAYSLGLLPATLIIFQSALLYARNVFHISVFFSCITVGINLGLNTLFVFVLDFGSSSIALATSISAWCNCLMLYRALLKKGWYMGYSFRSFSHLISATFLASITLFLIDSPLRQIFSNKLFVFVIPGCLFIGIIGVYAHFFKAHFFKNFDLKMLVR